VGILALVLVSFLGYEGIFNKATAFEGEEGGYQLMGIDHKGAYKNTHLKLNQSIFMNCTKKVLPDLLCSSKNCLKLPKSC